MGEFVADDKLYRPCSASINVERPATDIRTIEVKTYSVCSLDKDNLDSGDFLDNSYKSSKSIGYGDLLYETFWC